MSNDNNNQMTKAPPTEVASNQPSALERFAGQFGERSGPSVSSTMGSISAARQTREVEAQVAMARRFPRDRATAVYSILRECERSSFAQEALYNYSRGGSRISGPSIRMAELAAQQWGNLDFGIRQLDRTDDESLMEAYCYDLETNVRKSLTFTVKHWRDTKGGGYAVDSERDIYEVTANFAARRLRNCILAVIPKDVIDTAVEVCEATIRSGSGKTVAEAMKQLVYILGKRHGVPPAEIAKFLGRPIENATDGDVVALQGIVTALKDDVSSLGAYFPGMGDVRSQAATKQLTRQEPAKTEQPPAKSEQKAASSDQPAGSDVDEKPPADPPSEEPKPAAVASSDESGSEKAETPKPDPVDEADPKPNSPEDLGHTKPPPTVDPEVEKHIARISKLIRSAGCFDTDVDDYLDMLTAAEGVLAIQDVELERLIKFGNELVDLRPTRRKTEEGEEAKSERREFIESELDAYRFAQKDND